MSIEDTNYTESDNTDDLPADSLVTSGEELDAFEQEFHTGEPPEPSAPTNEDTQENDGEDNAPAPEDADDEDSSEDLEEGSANNEAEPDEKPKKKNRFQERIDELNGKYREEQRQRLAVEQRLAELERLAAQNNEPKTEDTPKETPKAEASGPRANELKEDGTPKYPLGEYDPQYIVDLADFRFEQRMNELETKKQEEEQAKAQEEAVREAQAAWEAKVTPAQERYPDYVEKTQALSERIGDLESRDPAYSAYLADAVTQLDNGPDVLYYLSNNPDEALEIINSGPIKSVARLGAISAQLGQSLNTQKTPAPKVSNAPEPPPVVNKGASAVAPDIRPDTDNLDQFEKILFKK